MKILKGFVIAFSIYSKIPVPQFDWKEEDMQYHLCFFPLIGLIIGALEAGWFFLGNAVGISHLCKTLIAVAIPLLVTGGFHMDGFMDTMDAFHSYQDKEKKLAILKDPHIGAFSVLMLVLYYLIYGAAYAELTELSAILVVGIGFALSRSLSGIGVVSLKAAKKRRYACLFCRQRPEKKSAGGPYHRGSCLQWMYDLCKPVGGACGSSCGIALLWILWLEKPEGIWRNQW